LVTIAVRASAGAGSGISEADADEIAPVEPDAELGDDELALNIFTFALGINRCFEAFSTRQPLGNQCSANGTQLGKESTDDLHNDD
jgi:hypothetical protein